MAVTLPDDIDIVKDTRRIDLAGQRITSTRARREHILFTSKGTDAYYFYQSTRDEIGLEIRPKVTRMKRKSESEALADVQWNQDPGDDDTYAIDHKDKNPLGIRPPLSPLNPPGQRYYGNPRILNKWRKGEIEWWIHQHKSILGPKVTASMKNSRKAVVKPRSLIDCDLAQHALPLAEEYVNEDFESLRMTGFELSSRVELMDLVKPSELPFDEQ
jgi:hypothetical protein